MTTLILVMLEGKVAVSKCESSVMGMKSLSEVGNDSG